MGPSGILKMFAILWVIGVATAMNLPVRPSEEIVDSPQDLEMVRRT